MHLINELRINMLINMNIQEIESIKINISKCQLKIDNCVKFSIAINVVDVNKRVDRLIRIKKIVFLSFYSIINVFIQIRDNFCLLIDKNYIFHSKIKFELKSKNDVYFYIVDINISIIQIRNVIDETYIVSRYVKLNRVLDYKKKILYSNVEKRSFDNQTQKTNISKLVQISFDKTRQRINVNRRINTQFNYNYW